MPAASPVPLPTPPVAPTSTHTTKDPYSLPPATPEQVFVEKKRRTGAVPPPLQMPEAQPGAPSPVAGVVPSPHHVHQMPHHPQMHDGYGYHHPSPMAVPQYQYPQQMVHHGSHMGTPMTPMTPMVMTPMSGPHPTAGFEHPTHMQHPQQYPQMNTGMGMGPMTPMTPMTSMSFMSDNSAHTGVPQHPQMHAMPVQYSMAPQQQGYDMHSAHSPMSPVLSTMSGQSSPTYGPTYAPTHDMGYQMQPAMQHTYQAVPQQVGYTYEGYGMDGQIQMVDGEMWQDGTDMSRRRDRRNRVKKDENQAVDAMRYKTKMCRNWELTNRCPYGPRCLFSHGRCELRTMAVNTEAICAAARSTTPQRAFYEQGRFPDFVPVPLELMDQMASGISNVNEIATQMA